MKKTNKNKGLSDEELIKKYEQGKISIPLNKILKKGVKAKMIKKR